MLRPARRRQANPPDGACGRADGSRLPHRPHRPRQSRPRPGSGQHHRRG